MPGDSRASALELKRLRAEVERALALLLRPALHRVRVDHRRLHVAVAQHFLDRADVIVGLQQMAGETVPERMRCQRHTEDGGPEACRSSR